jgi:hypothetical protein
MSTDLDPRVGDWYQRLDNEEKFEVVAVDESAGILQIQHFDGDLEELDLDEWYQMEIEPIEAPEDWTGPMDDIERDDLGYTEPGGVKTDWDRSIHELEKSPEPWEEEEPEAGSQEWYDDSSEQDDLQDEDEH